MDFNLSAFILPPLLLQGGPSVLLDFHYVAVFASAVTDTSKIDLYNRYSICMRASGSCNAHQPRTINFANYVLSSWGWRITIPGCMTEAMGNYFECL